MNWRRGLLRLWLVLSLCWIAGLGLYAWKQEPWILSSSQEFVFEGTPDSARDQQMKEGPLGMGPSKGKDFDTGNAVGPYLVTPDEIDVRDLKMTARINGAGKMP